jgi:hypothetical protein
VSVLTGIKGRQSRGKFLRQHSGAGGRQARGRNIDNQRQAPSQAGRRRSQKYTNRSHRRNSFSRHRTDARKAIANKANMVGRKEGVETSAQIAMKPASKTPAVVRLLPPIALR